MGGRFQIWKLIVVEAGILGERVPVVLVIHNFVIYLLGDASLSSTDISLGPFGHNIRHRRNNSVS